MFQKILIANRGEIACRVMTTAARMGIRTVAVYSDADARAKHVAMADEAVRIGPAAAAESYLRGQTIIEAALRTGAQAIHPGYGFLSENPDFVDAVEAAGLIFIGPPASAIRAMGLKDAAKTLMAEAGVPIVPGYHGGSQDPELLAAEAEKIGYPVLIKARAGGGGKGMRQVEKADDFIDALAGAQREGQASFGDPACLIEKYISKPRHIEIQVFGDSHGNAIHMFERDCSLQRRHQKVIEEAPAPGMPQAVRDAMGQAAVEAAKAIGYSGAGTVEFIADGSGPLREDGFWFLEMNTRLQVEHPVSEAITGLDFVELQFRVAAGEPLPVQQSDLTINGWAFEARIYAEDVAKGFLPATGRLDHLRFPDATAFEPSPLRIDSGVRQGDEISPWYDPMIAKVIVHGPTRASALNMLTSALQGSQIVGSVTNVEFLAELSRHEGFRKGQVDTGLITRDLEKLLPSAGPSPLVLALAALGGLRLLPADAGPDPWDSLVGWRHWSDAQQYVSLETAGERVEVQVSSLGGGRFTVFVQEESVTLSVVALVGSSVRIEVAEFQCNAEVVREARRVSVFLGGRSFSFDLPDALSETDEEEAGGDTIIAPMPGLVRAVFGKAGAAVTQGQPLIVLEAMKMEHTLLSPRDGVVADVLATEGEQVVNGALLLTLEPHDE
jgi:3-methylcrotonyl-CoA carboxylase alpha subunit